MLGTGIGTPKLTTINSPFTAISAKREADEGESVIVDNMGTELAIIDDSKYGFNYVIYVSDMLIPRFIYTIKIGSASYQITY